MGRYWRTLRRFWGTAVAVQLEYQANVLIELLAVAMSLSGSLFLLSLFYGPDLTLGGWSWAQALMVQGLYTVFDGMATTLLRPNLGAIVTHVREGTLDFVLLKPIDSQFCCPFGTCRQGGWPGAGWSADGSELRYGPRPAAPRRRPSSRRCGPTIRVR